MVRMTSGAMTAGMSMALRAAAVAVSLSKKGLLDVTSEQVQ